MKSNLTNKVVFMISTIPAVLLQFRWGQNPLDDAKQFGSKEVIEILEEYQQRKKNVMTDDEHRTLFKGAFD